MTSKDRRLQIERLLISSKEPLKGNLLAERFNVTRQVIVKDIAILRATGTKIIATPDGYIIYDNCDNKVRSILAINHRREEMIDELSIVIKYGGIIEDVIVEHSVYGEIKAMLMIKNSADLESFLKRFDENKAQPLSSLTEGVHLHTIVADNNENMEKIISELGSKNFLIT
ncbi:MULTISPECIES: transcription repressor NadR [Clostridium]|uniref:Transcription repressor NadR n=1 Tax=Clostridium cadaveris TaxID=1529 RepID=A0A316M0K2_9CLOT|nr:transcription repressor NadR [Clostridium cadaveris]MDU4953341.1 transcription repressor NadR [Clostridium sp.]PWL52122.1 MAG: transcription repressor NadR [Clostridium cadaveris]